MYEERDLQSKQQQHSIKSTMCVCMCVYLRIGVFVKRVRVKKCKQRVKHMFYTYLHRHTHNSFNKHSRFNDSLRICSQTVEYTFLLLSLVVTIAVFVSVVLILRHFFVAFMYFYLCGTISF